MNIKLFIRQVQWQKWTEGSCGTTLLLYVAFALVHDSRGIEIVNFTISLALSAGTMMASAGTPYRLVPAHFYPWTSNMNKISSVAHYNNDYRRCYDKLLSAATTADCRATSYILLFITAQLKAAVLSLL